jgi:hypothetical protein
MRARIRRTFQPLGSGLGQDGDGDAAPDPAGLAGPVGVDDGATDGAVETDGAAEADAAGDPLAPADDDGAADDEAAGEALASGDGLLVRKPPWPPTRP